MSEISETNRHINERSYNDLGAAPPAYTKLPTVPITNQPKMTTTYFAQGPGMQGNVAMVTGQPGTTTAVTPVLIMFSHLTHHPSPYQCRSCHQQIVTKMKSKPTTKTHFIAAGFCLVCLVPCAVLPYFVDACKQADHYCPNCDTFLGSYIP